MENSASTPTYDFIAEAVSLGIPGVHDQGGSPAAGIILRAESDEAFQTLQEHMRSQYTVIALDDATWGEWQSSHQAAYRVIERLRRAIR